MKYVLSCVAGVLGLQSFIVRVFGIEWMNVGGYVYGHGHGHGSLLTAESRDSTAAWDYVVGMGRNRQTGSSARPCLLACLPSITVLLLRW